MDDWDGDDREDLDEDPVPTRAPGEGVRILGAEEAAAALQSGHGEGREPLRFPPRSAPEGVTPAASFPLEVDPGEVPRPTVAMPAAPPTLPHWTEPPTGEVPSVLSGRSAEETDEDDLNAWSALSGGQPRWRDRHDAWDDSGYDDASVLADDQPPLGALDESRVSPFDFDDEHVDEDNFGALGDSGVGAVVDPIPLRQPPAAPERRSRAPRVPRTRPSGVPAVSGNGGAAEGRDLGAAVGLGVGIALVALLAFKLGPFWTALLVIGVVMLAAVELYDVLRRAGYQPATLLGLSATLALLVATYQEGEAALPLVTVLLVTFTFLWYLARVVTARPTVNAAATILAFMWTGFLGSFAMLMARPDGSRAGIAFLLGAVLATAFNDIGAYFVGSRMGSRPLAPEISPNKTWEGAIGGAVVCIVGTVLILGFVPGMAPWDGGKAFWLALVVSIVAPLGDLTESMIKRDLGIKDMGRLLPGHGGVMDRFDALLFVLPAVYYLVRVLYT